ncbi:MAG TPA: bifunctional phosphoglucose/phosphomannose isomerase [Acidimicrobiales bacterium]|nr:bifunctional phosphoglucose/phosphomannose isomerase [Acidimicrobiales bacterium]
MAVIDSDGMFDHAARFPEQVEEAFERSQSVTGLPAREDIENVVVIGMGGSGIAGDVLAAVASPLLPVPVSVVKNYECPHFVDESSLVFAVSCSGMTEETIEAATDAALAGAKMVVVASGGELAHLADGWRAPVIGLPSVPWPRVAFGAMAVPLIVVLWKMGLLPGADQMVERAVEQLKLRRDELVRRGDASRAADVARRIGTTVPVLHAGGALGMVAALRWKSQVNENAKRLAFASAQSELCHNEVCGWTEASKPLAELMSLVMLRHDGEHPQVGRRFEIVADLVRPFVTDVIEVRAEGEGDLAQLFDLTYFGDYVSLWMSAQAGVDPGPIEVLMWLKAQLAGPGVASGEGGL